MRRHIGLVHLESNFKVSQTRHSCDICSRSYIWPSDLSRHKRLAHASLIPQFACDICVYKTNQKRNLFKHISARHSQAFNLRHKCDKCSRSYRSSCGLSEHKRLEHAAVIPQFFCDVCEYKTKRKNMLSRHIIACHMQTSESKHNCNTCSRSYRSLSGLSQHIRLEHAEVKVLFNCDICGYRTKRKPNLTRHITAKHVNKLYLSRT
ncbi:zinc finger Y-chromosomal protein-like [Belonocnema kinseyi]|uniref:zinc finger Y-chromosomal protein-like n=1 Tax=Belonocnema kinseyi TaxID=2817044 RepID=UPI00143DE520|nr:zinc finger Y-chromosomal protein-like [Belonocnema kinseyi]